MIEGVVNDNVESERKFQPIDLSNASSGNWVIARYEGEYFLGLILEITEKKIKQEFNALKNPLELLSPNHWSHTAMFFMIMMIYLEPMLYHLWFLTNQIEGKSNTLILSEDISLWMLCCDTYISNLHYDSVLQPSKFTSAVGNCRGFYRGKQCFYSNHLGRNIAQVIIS